MKLPAVSLRTRIVAAIVAVTTTATAVMAYTAYQVQADEAVGRFAWSAVRNTAADRKVFLEFAGPESADRLGPDPDWALVFDRPGGGLEVVRSAAGYEGLIPVPDKLTMLRAVRGDLFPPGKGPEQLTSRYTSVPQTGRKVFVVNANLPKDGYHLVEFFDFSRFDDDLTALRWKLVRIALGVSVLGVGAALLIGRRIRRPIAALSTAADELGAGALGTRVPVKGRDEVAALAASFNTMAARLGESIDELHAKDRQQRRFVADVAHDLRTPLASMLATVDSLDHAEPATRTRAAEILGTQTRRLAKLVEDLLEIARFDAGKADLRVAPVDLADLVRDTAEVVGTEAAVTATGDVTVVADPRRVHTVVANLLSNAVRHGAAPVTITLDGTGDDVVVRVADAGPGVPEELLPILFDRFTRGDHARQVTEGSGLGLAIARENVLAHGGSLAVHNDGGAVFTVRLPRGAANA
ncbi:sensor histidine kinase [Amycolatopsis vancoresmycina]|uniref:Signal transduction histidine-protein kinase/phosphatase MprB n=1 Tax=Amycolatopsis vancoresmycina DSM 44592 TaxID=1292037 RepID=R1HZX6_9PSEU|nr:HAMP domain-containing sensor histidine kinase [Amycolatopsis vancoresmycina]EOD69040.1 two-component system histidine kinase [Amycolatopsis vancoresmycina DSM 44592]